MTPTPDSARLDTSPLSQFLDIEQVTTPDGVECRIAIDGRHLNPNGSMHGGAMFTLLDLAMGVTTSTYLEPTQMCATAEIRVRYLKPVFEGSVVATASVVDHQGRRISLEARATDDRGEEVATASATFIAFEPREGSAYAG
ncbi:MAG: PaaI family thioesterase [Actinobacteria bacterium]|nr:PaaI family thioesterase [Actinomycetota bacterium]